MNQIENDEEIEAHFRVHVDGRLLARIEALLEEPSLGFTSIEHYVAAALHSFTSYKERQVERLQGDAQW